MKQNLLLIGIAAALALTAGTTSAALTAFKVNGEQVSAAEQKAVYDQAVAQGQPAGDRLERAVRNDFISRTVVLQEARKAKVENDPLVKQAVARAREDILMRAYGNHWVKANPVSDKDVRAEYDREKKIYGDTEYQIRVIMVKTEDQAKNLISRIKKGSDFGKLASEFSEDTQSKSQGGLLDWVSPARYGEPLGTAISLLKAGEVAQAPIRLQNGFAIVKLEATRPAQNFPAYDTAKEQLRSRMANVRFNEHVQKLVSGAKVQ